MAFLNLPTEIILQITAESDLESIVNLYNTCKSTQIILSTYESSILKNWNPKSEEDVVLSQALPIGFYDLAYEYDQKLFNGQNTPGQYQKLSVIQYFKTIYKFKLTVQKILETYQELKSSIKYTGDKNYDYRLVDRIKYFAKNFQRYSIIGPPKEVYADINEVFKDLPRLYPTDPAFSKSCLYHNIRKNLEENEISQKFWVSTGFITDEKVEGGNPSFNRALLEDLKITSTIMTACRLSHPTNILKFIRRGRYDRVVFERFIKALIMAHKITISYYKYISRRRAGIEGGRGSGNTIGIFQELYGPEDILVFRDWDTLDQAQIDDSLRVGSSERSPSS